jgi:DNA gyrase subunit A
MSDETIPTPGNEEEKPALEAAAEASAAAAAPEGGDEGAPAQEEKGITRIAVQDEMRTSYIDYSMSVIVARAIPDARDGMKPVHRRCVFSMGETGNTHDKPYKKAGRVVGDVMGKYHPHGDSSIYETIVRMAQDFSLRYLMVDGHGNFGSIDGDGAAAMRYTEVRMQRYAEDMLVDLDKDTVDMVSNYDETLEEPTVLPCKVPNLLLNGAMGIAVGMSTNIPSHNMNELCDAIVAMIDDPAITVEGLMQYVKGPDFPTGGIVCGLKPIERMYREGRASLVVRGRTHIEREDTDRPVIVIDEIPYGVNKAEMLQRIKDLGEADVIKGIDSIRDLSKEDIRAEIELKRGYRPAMVLAQIFKYTPLQSTFAANMLALDHGRPMVMDLKKLLKCFIDHREQVIARRTKFLLRKAKERKHLLEGFRIAVDNIDEIVRIIRGSRDDAEAKAKMLERFGLDDLQSSAILEMRLRQLTGLQREKIEEEYREVLASIEKYEFILATPGEIQKIIKADCKELKEKYGDARRTDIIPDDGEIDIRKVIPNTPCVVTLTRSGYIKRSLLKDFQSQHRGGKGRKGAHVKAEDEIISVLSAKTHDQLFFFTNLGRVFTGHAWDIPEAAKIAAAGSYLNNFLALRPAVPAGTVDPKTGKELPETPAERVVAVLPFMGFDVAEETGANEKAGILFATRNGVIKKSLFSEFRNVNKAGIWAINLRDGDELVGVAIVEPGDEAMLVSAKGQALKFPCDKVRAMGRQATGVRGLKLRGVTVAAEAEEEGDPEAAGDEGESAEEAVPATGGKDELRALVKVDKAENARLLLLSENGYGSLTRFADYPLKNRGGMGVKAMKTEGRNGEVVFAGAAHVATADTPAETVLVMTAQGQSVRTDIGTIRETGRNAMGVKVVELKDAKGKKEPDVVATAAVTPPEEPDEAEEESDAEEPPTP